MKFMNEFVENDTIETQLMVFQVTKGIANNGSPYLSVTFQDKTGQIEAKVWDVKPEQANLYAPGVVGSIKAEVLKYRNAHQLKLVSFVPLKDPDMSRFIATSDIPVDVLKEQVFTAIDGIVYGPLQRLVRSLVLKHEDAFFAYPAASKNHHEYMSGLSTHVCGMLKLGNSICDLYPSLNRDLVMAGILMHDLGKIVELSGPSLTEYTFEGRLLGHISIAQAMIAEEAKLLGIEQEECVVLLRHMVLSHHGAYEYGSPVLPLIPEAEMLTYIDNIDARMNMLEKSLVNVVPGGFATRSFALENRTFYQSKFDK